MSRSPHFGSLFGSTALALFFVVGASSTGFAQSTEPPTNPEITRQEAVEELSDVAEEAVAEAAENANATNSTDRRCVQPNAGASQAAIDAFKANPPSLLEQNPLGGLALSNEVRSLAATDVDTVPLIIGLEEAATERQARALGAGLARAAAICVATNPELAEEIQLAVAASDNEALVTAFLTGAGNQDTAGIPGGVPGGAPGGGAAGIGGSPAGGSTNLAGTSVGNAGATLGGGGGGGAAGGNAGDDDPVSPVI